MFLFVMSPLWNQILNQRFYYTKEMLLGVAIWQKSGPNEGIINVQHKDRKPNTVVSLIKRLGLMLIFFLTAATVGLFVAPRVYFALFPPSTIEIKPKVIGTPLGGAFEENLQPKSQNHNYLPELDSSLPEGNWIIIPEIGVKANYSITENANEALQSGVWLSPDYGKPGDQGMPIIMAAHRFGWDWWWQSDFGKLNSFYRLPETKQGTIVELISDQRKWTYEVFAAEEGEEITRYDADLILYTCKYLSSSVRYIRYARLIKPIEN